MSRTLKNKRGQIMLKMKPTNKEWKKDIAQLVEQYGITEEWTKICPAVIERYGYRFSYKKSGEYHTATTFRNLMETVEDFKQRVNNNVQSMLLAGWLKTKEEELIARCYLENDAKIEINVDVSELEDLPQIGSRLEIYAAAYDQFKLIYKATTILEEPNGQK